jgi:hypothetical protein
MMLKRQTLTIEIVYEDSFADFKDTAPSDWDWRALLDLNPNESCKIVNIIETCIVDEVDSSQVKGDI